MIDWEDPQVQQVCVVVFGQVNVFVLGAYLYVTRRCSQLDAEPTCHHRWYIIWSLPDVEFGLLLGRTRFGLAHVRRTCLEAGHTFLTGV